jgi:hypothetical protein
MTTTQRKQKGRPNPMLGVGTLDTPCREGIPAPSGPHLRLNGGTLDGGTTDVRRGRSYKLMGSPAKNWSKLLTRRSTAVGTLGDAGSLMQNHVQ